MGAGYIDDFDAFKLPNLRAVGTGHDCDRIIMIRGPQKSARDVGVAADSSGVCCSALLSNVTFYISSNLMCR